MAAYRAVLADEHVLFMEGLRRILTEMKNPDIQVIATAQTGKDLLKYFETNEADLAIIEVSLSDMDYEEMIKKLKSLSPKLKIIILSAYGDIKLVRNCFTKGIDGYSLKSNSLDNLKNGIIEVLKDQIFIGNGLQVSPQLHEEPNEDKFDHKNLSDRFLIKQKLTKRELQILKMIVDGLNNRQISKELFISHETVGVHKKNIKKKLGIYSTPSLIEFAIENRLVD